MDLVYPKSHWRLWQLAFLLLLVLFIGCVVQTVSAVDPPNASFSCTPLSGLSPLSVTCTDGSTNSPTGWAWYFGDETYKQPWILENPSSSWLARSDFGYVNLNNGTIVLFGGEIPTPIRKNDVWASYNNGSTWNLVNASVAWAAREDFAFAHLPDDSIVLMGGTTGTLQNDTWRSIDGGNVWVPMSSSSGWTKRRLATSVALPNGHILLMGGLDISGVYKNDTWRSTDGGATWSLMSSNPGWVGRFALSSTVMNDGSIIIFGGGTPTSIKDIWKSTDEGITWTLVNSNPSWTSRRAPNILTMPDSSILLMGGSLSGASGIRDVWRSTDNGSTWSQINTTPWGAGKFLGGSVQLPNGSIVVFGGFSTSYTNDTWMFSPQGDATENSVHIYNSFGTFSVALKSYNLAGYNSTIKSYYIFVNPQYYAYGDSITRATGYDLLNASGFDCYLLNMTRRYDLSNASGTGHNMDAGGKTSDWLLSNFATHPGLPEPKYYFTMAGINDRANNASYTANETADNLISICNLTITNGSSKCYILIEPADYDAGTGDWSSFANQKDNITKIQDRLSTLGHPYIRAYDAIDLIPENNVFDNINSTTQVGVHPNVIGHSLIADYVWNAINSPMDIPTANFSANITSGQTPLLVLFSDTSTNSTPIAWNWSFGDGQYSDLQSPTHQYATPGNYSVSEMVTGAFGSNTLTKTDYINAYSILPSFTASPLSGSNPLSVKFNDMSYSYWPISSWRWDFGDGVTSIIQNVSHTYTTDGYYSVNLTIIDSLGNKNYTLKSNYINVNESFPAQINPIAIFESNLTTGYVPLTVQFYDESINATSRNWSFGDGTYSTTLNPQHTYSIAGQYDVNLSVSNAYSSTYLLKQKYINALTPGTNPHLYYWLRVS